MEEDKIKTEKKVKEAKVVQVATATADMIQLPTGEVVSTNDLLVLLYNEIQKVKEAVV
jgi:hypothetical protein